MNILIQEQLNKRQVYKKQWAKDNIDKVRASHRAWYARNSSKVREWHLQNPDKIKSYKLKWRKANPDKVRANGVRWAKNNRDRLNARMRKWNKDNPSKRRARATKYLTTNINARIAHNLRARFRRALSTQSVAERSHLKDLIGTSIPNLRSHLEKQFQPGMTWDNYGKWHVDHIYPLAKFDLIRLSLQKKAMRYTNLQPLWAFDNLQKNSKIML